MEPDIYQVDVLHYLNPHLIWVQVVNSKKEELLLEQIGIYGILPLEPVLNMDGSIGTQKCDRWMPAATVIMKNSLSDAEEIWFLPTHIDRRSSIFDNNIHKYGNLIIKKPNGKTKDVTKYLLKSGFAFDNVALFHQELASGNLKTKLNRLQTQEIVNQLELHYKNKDLKHNWECSVRNQMSVLELSNNFEAKLTARNLERHNRDNLKQLIENKLKDFEKCKDVEEVSVGRARHKKCIVPEKKTTSSSSLLKRKLAVSKAVPGMQKQDAGFILEATKKFLEDNAEARNSLKSENIYNGSNSIKEDSSVDSEENMKSIKRSELDMEFFISNKDITFSKQNIIHKDIRKVAFGPPDISRNKLILKSLNDLESNHTLDNSTRSNYHDIEHENDTLGRYSDINLSITNLDLLKTKNDEIMCQKKTIDTPINENEIKTMSYNLNTGDNFDEDTENKTLESKNRFNILKNKIIINNNSHLNNNDQYLTNSMEYNKEKQISGKIKFSNGNGEIFFKDIFNKVDTSSKDDNLSTTSTETTPKVSNLLRKKLRRHKELKNIDSSSDTSKSFEVQKQINQDSDDENIEEIVKRLDLKTSVKIENKKYNNNSNISKVDVEEVKINVNPFKNLDGSKSIFVEKLINPILMVHTKKSNCIQPRSNIRDIPFGMDIHIVLRNMGVKELTRLQSVSWYTILRGHSTFLISPLGSGKTMGYLPAVCKLVADYVSDTDSPGPISIIVCATAKSVSDVEKQAKMFFGFKEKVLAYYSGMSELDLATALLNGCNLFITTPSLLVRLLQAEFGIDLRRLTTIVLDDCERLIDVYIDEVKFLFFNVKEMLKSRANKETKVQIIVASRKWSGYLDKLAKRAPDTVVCFGAFQECVLYSKVNTTVDFIRKENKIKAVLEFVKDIDTTKRTVIVCRNDDEVNTLAKCLEYAKYVVFCCNSTMTVQELYNINIAWADYREPVLGPVLICCDGNVNHLNVTNAHYLIHYSLPDLFSMFCRRFTVLIDNYPSIFKENIENIKIKVLLDDENVEQLPKILNFCKRCTDNVPEVLDKIAKTVLAEKDLMKAKEFVPICDNLLALGECPDFWNCLERHSILKEYDDPKYWMPTEGTITFKVIYYHTPALLSARLLTNTVQNQTRKYAQTYSTLSLKMGMYYSNQNNKRLHGIPKLGDVCTVAIRQNFFERCQILKILNHYPNGKPKFVLVKLIDEERYEKVKDIYLYYLPNELKNIETHIVRVRLADVQVKDKDATFPDLATAEFKKITDKDDKLFLRGRVVLAVGNSVFVDTLEACQELTSLSETVVKHNFKKDLLDKYAISKLDHIATLKNLCEAANIIQKKEVLPETSKVKPKFKARWAYLDSGVFSEVFLASAQSASQFFVRLVKFEKCMFELIQDIKKYVEDNAEPLTDVQKDDIVIAMFPDDNTYERARVEEICDENKVKCFFVDQGEWRYVPTKHLVAITQKLVDKIPFQSIECSLVGVEPVGNTWSEFSTNWLSDKCYDSSGKLKHLYLKYFRRDLAEITNGCKYSIALIDTYDSQDIIINQMMILLNLAKTNDEFKYLDELISKKTVTQPNELLSTDDKVNTTDDLKILPKITNSYVERIAEQNRSIDNSSSNNDSVAGMQMYNPNVGKLIRSVPLVTDDPMFDPDRWDVYNPTEMMPVGNNSNGDKSLGNIISIKHKEQKSTEVLNNQTSSNHDITSNMPGKGNSTDKRIFEGCINKAQHDTHKQTCSNISLDSDDLSTSVSEKSESGRKYTDAKIKELKPPVKVDVKNKLHKVEDETSKPKLCWRQNQSTVYVKILLIGVKNYSLIIEDRSISFSSLHNDVEYSFNFDIYGGVHKAKCNHSNKGQYILVTLSKIIKRNWLTLTKDGGIRKWIVYDVDAIDTSSDEEVIDTSILECIKNLHEQNDSDSDCDESLDDEDFTYRKSQYTY
ncbi:hypothetical protein K1T71_014117 [Dendrolimus kikuchii]|uniref:Uncharacterized protein n=1 Tax=Dendrolimus kikuchii TaxID=765133 RepID=A0ACC1CF31_9NEOP|nr:hypothetical protein K1T71_014117 [Dendrolimus kikuchii]